MAEISIRDLINLVNEHLDTGACIDDENTQVFDMVLYDSDVIDKIIKTMKFKNKGCRTDYPDELPQADTIDIKAMATNEYNSRIYVSSKHNAIMYITGNYYYFDVTFVVDGENVKKFVKKIVPLFNEDTGANLFNECKFESTKGMYYEIINGDEKSRNPKVSVIQRNITNETLVFDKGSELENVLADVCSFFSKETESLYAKIQVPYKRGIVLYGDPGNGKSAMIRELFRKLENTIKIVINPGIYDVTEILDSLVKALKGKKAIIVIEDMDSVITPRNRSKFLNILDGVNITSGVLFMGTTNYPERVDPAFMNRAGRFDKTYKIDNPTEEMRRLFFKSKGIDEILQGYTIFKSKKGKPSDIIQLFVNNSADVPMANLKEIITSTCYLLSSKLYTNIEEAVTEAYSNIFSNRETHTSSYVADKRLQESMKHKQFSQSSEVDDDYNE